MDTTASSGPRREAERWLARNLAWSARLDALRRPDEPGGLRNTHRWRVRVEPVERRVA
ncbi:MAG: hypothetical protein ACXVJ7_06390 [Acidimicrobiia bacterium]